MQFQRQCHKRLNGLKLEILSLFSLCLLILSEQPSSAQEPS
jgi:hypothetical protein